MLRLRNVTFRFDRDAVVEDASLAVEEPSLVCVVGPNGAGKSTLLRLIAGLHAPQAGTVEVFGRDPARTKRRLLARQVAYVAQEVGVAFPFTVQQMVLMGRYPHGRRGFLATDSAADVEIAADALDSCDLADLAARRFDCISGGEQRRTLLAQAFCQRASVILLDEPTDSLDPAHAIAIFNALRSAIAGGTTAVVVTHDLNLAARFGDRLLLMHRGRLLADGEPRTVLSAAETETAFGVSMHVGTLPDGQTAFVVPCT